MSDLPPPRDLRAPVPVLAVELAGHLGSATYVEMCGELLAGADRAAYLPELGYLTGFAAEALPGWDDYWLRTWGARGLLHVWDDTGTRALRDGLADEHWRPAEMCLKVAARHEVAVGDRAVGLCEHERSRVRLQAARAIGAAGDTEHVDAVRSLLDDQDPAVRRAAGRALDQLITRLDLPG